MRFKIVCIMGMLFSGGNSYGQSDFIDAAAGFKQYLSVSLFKESANDTSYYLLQNGQQKIHEIIHDSLLTIYYPSGNLLGTGLVKPADCSEYFDKSGVNTNSVCIKWTVYGSFFMIQQQ